MTDWPELLFREGEPTAMTAAKPTTPAGAHAEHPVYDAEHLPAGNVWRWFRKRQATHMAPIGGPATIVTCDGPVTLPVGWRGWVAIDATGHPYPVAEDVHRRSYEPAGEPG